MPHSLSMTREARQRYVIQRARQARGLTQRELGQRVGVSPSTISLLENGRRMLDAALAARLATALQLQGEGLQQLLGSTDPAQWRTWIWRSACTPNEKLVLLALLESPEHVADVESLVARTGLPAGTVHALTDSLHRRGHLRRVFDSETATVAWRFAVGVSSG